MQWEREGERGLGGRQTGNQQVEWKPQNRERELEREADMHSALSLSLLPETITVATAAAAADTGQFVADGREGGY